MQTAKDSQQFKFDHYEVTITAYSDKKLGLKVIDSIEKIEFYEKMLTLANIGTSTLLKAFTKSNIEIKMGMKVKKTAETAILQIDVLVASQFLRPLQETIYIKKLRDVSQSQILKNSLGTVNSKIKSIKDQDKNTPNIVRCGSVQEDAKSYSSGANYEEIAVIKLPKGKYVLTLSFLVKATNSWMYLYFQQGQQVIYQCGFYVPAATQYIPMVVRKAYNVTNDQQKVQFTTYYGQSYPITLKNVVLTAQVLQ